MYTLGIDLGSSSVKASILHIESGMLKSAAYAPEDEMIIISEFPGWAEQDPRDWWSYMRIAVKNALNKAGISKEDIRAIGISYQMHGLVMVDSNLELLGNSIIWCDSRAAYLGNKAFDDLGEAYCNRNLLNSPGNFTASKLKWIQLNRPDVYNRIHKIMLPGDYIAMRMTGSITTTRCGLSEGIFWDMKEDRIADRLLDYYSINHDFIPALVPTFGEQGRLTPEAAHDLGLEKGTLVSFRAGDQPNNAFSLNVLEPGDVAATAGTSGVLYGIATEALHDPLSRVNTFLHVNHLQAHKRYGVLFCLNGAGILYKWLRKLAAGLSYENMNEKAAIVKPGCEGLTILPFGNGAERMLLNRDPGCSIWGLNFNIHTIDHFYRAALESIAYSMRYGIDILRESGIEPKIIRAGKSNLFLSNTFVKILASLSGTNIQLYNTDGALGSARAAALGAGFYRSEREAFEKLEVVELVEPAEEYAKLYKSLYEEWLSRLSMI